MKGLEAKTLGLRKMLRHEYKRIVAFMLTVAMVVTNFGTNLTVAFAAGEEESSLFLLNSSELEDAISAALESGDVFDFSSLELKAKQKSLKTSYEKLIGSKAGKVYQLDVDVDSTYATENTDLQVFYNAGTDSVVFLFINQSDMAVTFRANVSGYETARVTVNPNTSNIEDAEGVENAEDYSNTTMVDDEKKPQAEVVKPEGETSESESASDETEAAETEADVTESENASENGEAEETTGAEEAAETETSEAAETEAETEPETEAEAPAAEETEAEIELTPEEGSASASISAKKVFRVSTSAEAAGEAPAADAAEETETEAEEPEKETEAPVETTAEETVADDSTEETIADETQADETTAADETDGELTDETEAPTEDVTAPDETNGEEPADNGGSENIGFDNDEQFLEDDSIELAGELNGKAYNTVTIWGSANARAYVVKAEDLTGEAAVEGQYSVDYSVDPVGAATIKGAHTVNEGETLYFAVDPQVGYEITEVTANGEPLEAVDAADVASASDLEQHEHVYAVEAVTEDLEIVASLEETVGVAHPEFSASYVSSEGVTISLHAEEGILPEGTELSVTEVTDALGDTIKEKMDSETEGTTVHSVLAYDINLLYNGKKLSNSWSESGYVDVTFTGAPIQEMTEASDKVEIVAVDDTSATKLSADNAAEAEASELKLETVGEQNVEGTVVEEVGFKAEHFTIYAIAGSGSTSAVPLEEMLVGKNSSKTIYSDNYSYDYWYTWESSDTSILRVGANTRYNWYYNATTITTYNKTGIVTLRLKNSRGQVLDEAIISVGTGYVTAQFYHLKDPTKTPDSNNTSEWSSNLGTGLANETGAVWTDNKNIFNAGNRVEEWPSGYGTKTADGKLELTRNTTTWNEIYTKFKDQAAKNAGVTINSKDDVEAIYLVPYKISRNNGTHPDHHVDCIIEMKVKTVVTVSYRLKDASTDNVYRAPEDNKIVATGSIAPRPTGSYPARKQVNGVWYEFDGWYTNPELTGDPVDFNTYVVNENTTFYAKYVGEHKVSYDWTGLPTGVTLYDEQGNVVTPALPRDITGLKAGQSYDIDTTMPGTVVYTHDGFGNKNAKYTLGAWNDPNNGVMGESNVLVTGIWTSEVVNVPEYRIVYSWTGTVPDGVTLPNDNHSYKNNETYVVDTTYGKGYTVNSYDQYHNVNGVYTFSGWDTQPGRIQKNLEIKGIWSFEKTSVAQHNVSYQWSGLPKNATLYDEADVTVEPELPININGLVKGQPYQINRSQEGTAVYTHDEYGNRNAKYTFGTWTDPNNGVMGESDVLVTGIWTSEVVDVPEYSIVYSWTGTVPDGVSLPEDDHSYKNNETYVVDTTYGKGYTVNSYDQYHNVNGVYTFSGWDTQPGRIQKNLEIKGIWSFEKTSVAQHNVSYQWSGLPENATLYNEADVAVVPELPTSINGLVKGQSYKINRSQEKIAVYTHDEYGNRNAKYTLGTWNDPNNGVMGERDVLVTGEWTRENIEVQKYKVTYKYVGSIIPSNAPQVPVTAEYVKNQPVNVEETPEIKGYSFNGWNRGTSNAGSTFNMPAEDVELTGSFVKNSYPYFVTYHYEDAKGNEIYADDSVKNVLAEFESVIPYDTTSPKQYAIDGKDHNFVLDKVVFGNTQGAGKTAIVTDVAAKNNVDVYYALDELGTNPENPTNPNKPDGIADKYQIVFTYVADDHGTVTGMLKEVVTRYEGDKKFSTTAPAYPIAENIVATPDAGYKFVNWTSRNPSEASANIVAVFSRILQQSSATNAEFKDVAAIRAAGFTQDTEFTAHFLASDATTYKVEVYYEHEGKYSAVPSKTETLAGTTDTQAAVKAETYLPTSGYVFDKNAANVLSGTIAGDNSLVLKVYYKQVFKVTYAPGDHGSFKSQTYTVSYGSQTPGFSGDKTANGNYRFTGWDKTIESRVTGDIVYTAQWAANSNGGGGNGGGGGGSSSGGGGGSSSGPRDNGSTPSGGPGATTVTIDPDAVPLANLPNEDGAADLLVIDDEDVPLAALPKTGQSGASGLVLFLSSMMLAAFVAVSKKREDDK